MVISEPEPMFAGSGASYRSPEEACAAGDENVPSRPDCPHRRHRRMASIGPRTRQRSVACQLARASDGVSVRTGRGCAYGTSRARMRVPQTECTTPSKAAQLRR